MKNFSGAKILAIAITLCVALVTIIGLVLSGSPAMERARRIDNQRISELQQISYSIDSFYGIQNRLPQDLIELQQTRNIYLSSILDPKSREPYSYIVKNNKLYELCADFEVPTDPKTLANYPRPIYSATERYDSGFWNHGVGRTCFSITATPPAQPIK